MPYGPGGQISGGTYTGGGGAAGMAGLAGLLGPAALSFLPGLLSHLFGGDPQAKLRQQIGKLQNPQNLGRLTGQYYQNNLASPAYSQAQGTIAAGANAGAGQLASELGARGIGTTGTGAVLSSLTPSIVGSQTAGLRTQAYGMAQNSAQQQIQQQIQQLLAGYGQPSQSQQMFGAGLNSFAPYLQQYLSQKYPGTFGTTGG